MGGDGRARTLRDALTGAARSLAEQGVQVVSSELRVSPLLDSLGVVRPKTLGDTWDVPTGDGGPGSAGDSGAGWQSGPGDLGRFEVDGELGRGGMGRVLEARDPELRRRVAVKVLLDPDTVEPNRLARFVAEAQLTSQLEHPNIVPVHDIGVTDDGQIFFVMKKVTGRSLGEVLAGLARGTERVWTRRRLMAAFVQIGQAIAYAHDRGVLHRDLKPDNVMLGEFGEVLVMDWGLARVRGDAPEASRTERIDRVAISRTMDGAVIGTPGYMSPEQAQGLLAHLDERSDVFSLGAILYEILTLQRPYVGEDALEVLLATLAGPPQDPRERAPERDVPDELAEIALRAMASRPAGRYRTAKELVDAVEAHLEGARRMAEAAERVARAEARWAEYERYHVEETELRAREKALVAEVNSWAPLDDPGKRELLAVRERLEELGPERATKFGKAVAAAEQALSHAPEHAEAKEFLARAYWSRFEAAERARDVGEQAYYADRVREYDRGVYLPKLEGIGALTLATDPPGAEVWCERYEQKGLVWPLVERRLLGRTPIEKLPMQMGSYLLTLVSPGKRDTRYPVYITRGKHWHSGDEPIPLYTDEEIGEGFVYVPAGEFLAGGDPVAGSAPARTERVEGFFISVLPQAANEYCRFLNHLAQTDPKAALQALPRKEEGLNGAGVPYWSWDKSGAITVPAVDADGDAWSPRLPIFAVSWFDVTAAAAFWRGRLPSEAQWEKAARGVDGRSYPWGPRFEASICSSDGSVAGRPQPTEVGASPTDVSPYGVRDVAGGVREWMSNGEFDGDPSRRPVRGGAWCLGGRQAHAANRYGFEPRATRTYIGFRVARELKRTTGRLAGPGGRDGS